MSSTIILFIYGILVVLSFIGWGYLFSVYLFRSENKNTGWFAGIGLSIFIFIGGILNISKSVSKLSLTILLTIGIIVFIYYFFKEKIFSFFKKTLITGSFLHNKKFYCCVLILFFIIILKYTAVISPGLTHFNQGDDYQGYFVFSEKMIQTGSIGEDPFSERKIISSLGGQNFLDTLVLLPGRERNLGFTDMGIGFILFIVILVGFLDKLRIPRKYFLLIIFSAACVPAPIVNITSMYTGMALFTMLVWMLYNSRTYKTIDIVIFSLVLSSLCTLKNSFIPAGFLLAASMIILRFIYEPKIIYKRLRETFILVISFFVFLLSWMISLYYSSGTFLYPFLGKGFHGSVYGDFLTPTSQINIGNFLTFAYSIQDVVFLCLFLFICFYIIPKKERDKLKREDILVVLVAVLNIFIVGVATGGYGVA